MRSYHAWITVAILLATAALSGCNYNFEGLVGDLEDMTGEDTGDNTEFDSAPITDGTAEVVEDSDTGEPADTGEDMDCGFEVTTGVGTYAHPHSNVSYKLIGYKNGQVKVGEPIEVVVEVTASPCGSVTLHGVEFLLSEPTRNNWVHRVGVGGIYAFLADHNGEGYFEANSGYEVPGELPDSRVSYRWYNLNQDSDYMAEMDSMYLGAGETMYLTFTFNASYIAHEGDVGTITLEAVTWRDNVTSQWVNDDYYWNRQGGYDAGVVATTFTLYE